MEPDWKMAAGKKNNKSKADIDWSQDPFCAVLLSLISKLKAYNISTDSLAQFYKTSFLITW